MNLDFDKDANRILVALLSETERRAVANRRCCADDVNQWLTLAYIERCAEYHHGAAVYLPNEEIAAANSFLWQCLGTGMKTRFGKHVGKCAAQLANQTSLYFPDYETLLEMRFMAFMANKPSLSEIKMSGLVRQAVGTLHRDMALDVVRRECRRLGLDYDKLFVPQDIYELRVERRSIRQISR
ncbi:MAG: hypothetical protein KKD64_15410 [Alphaproteobacteria bacterium]|nr:hypothetical protein [Alphaproteobacteria bacterium]MBU0793611.1 hypothetical protein [Alphaproteobacteria bacterium]MBU0876135.1 hypothetical protein [Alphaproteobacteria bacterium]MBU1771026.1 hypothetical protein [Alphaproteobacteria bacterium]